MALWLGIWLSGCQSLPERKAYQTLSTTQEVVGVAMHTLGSLNRAGELTAAEYDRTQSYYREYQAAMNLAMDLAMGDEESWTPQKVMLLATQLIELIERLDE